MNRRICFIQRDDKKHVRTRWLMWVVMLMSLSMYAPRFRTEVDVSTVVSPSLKGSRSNVFSRLAVVHQMNSVLDGLIWSRLDFVQSVISLIHDSNRAFSSGTLWCDMMNKVDCRPRKSGGLGCSFRRYFRSRWCRAQKGGDRALILAELHIRHDAAQYADRRNPRIEFDRWDMMITNCKQ